MTTAQFVTVQSITLDDFKKVGHVLKWKVLILLMAPNSKAIFLYMQITLAGFTNYNGL